MRIGEVAQRTGLSISNIRFYEKKGLIGPDRNAQNRYREYEEEDVRRLEEIILYRKMDFTIETIADLLEHKTDVQQAMEAQIDHTVSRSAQFSMVNNCIRLNYSCMPEDKSRSFRARLISAGKLFRIRRMRIWMLRII